MYHTILLQLWSVGFFFNILCISLSICLVTFACNIQADLSINMQFYVYMIIYRTDRIPHNADISKALLEIISVYFSPLEISRISHSSPSHYRKESFLAFWERGSSIEISTKRVCPLSVFTGICAEEMLTQEAFHIKYILVAENSCMLVMLQLLAFPNSLRNSTAEIRKLWLNIEIWEEKRRIVES